MLELIPKVLRLCSLPFFLTSTYALLALLAWDSAKDPEQRLIVLILVALGVPSGIAAMAFALLDAKNADSPYVLHQFIQQQLGGAIRGLDDRLSKIGKAVDSRLSESEMNKAKAELYKAREELELIRGELVSSYDDNQKLKTQLLEIQQEMSRLSSEKDGEATERKRAEQNAQKALAEKERAEKERFAALTEVQKVAEGEASRARNLMPDGLLDTSLAPEIREIKSETESEVPPRDSVTIMAALAQIRGAQADAKKRNDLYAGLKNLGDAVASRYVRLGLSEERIHDKLAIWANDLNLISDGGYRVVVPERGERINMSSMNRAGTSQSDFVTNVRRWGVRSEKGGVYINADVL
jgi:hypothetical protein